jgi:hypothetical protein
MPLNYRTDSDTHSERRRLRIVVVGLSITSPVDAPSPSRPPRNAH